MQEEKLTDQWETPPGFFNLLDKEFEFDLDVCASLDNYKHFQFIRREENALTKSWTTVTPTLKDIPATVWCNPPYSNPLPWVEKAISEVQAGTAKKVVMLLPNASSTAWSDLCFRYAKEVRLLRPRIKFIAPPGWEGGKDSNRGDSMLAIFYKAMLRRPKIHHWNWK